MKFLKLILSILIALTLSNEITFAQETFEWTRSYSDPGHKAQVANDIVTDDYGNMYITGINSSGFSVADMVTVKYNSSGQFVWGRTYNTSSDYTSEHGKSIALYKNGTKTFIYAGGEVAYNGGASAVKILKYDEFGNLLWDREYDPAVPLAYDKLVKVASDVKGNCYIAGSSQSNFFIAKYDSTGDRKYSIVVPALAGYYYAEAWGMDVDAAGSVYVTGSTDTSSTKYIYTIKYDSAGNQKWAKLFKGNYTSQSTGRSIKVSSTGNVYLIGEFHGSNMDYITIKYNPANGDTIWTRKYNGTANVFDMGRLISIDASENIYVSGITNYNGNGDMVTVKYNSSGTQQWTKTFAGPGGYLDDPRDIITDAAGNVYIAFTIDVSYFCKYAILKYSTTGTQLWLGEHDFALGDFENPNAMAFDNSGNVIVTGLSGAGQQDFGTIKYSPLGAKLWSVKFYGAQITKDVSNHIITDKRGNVYVAGKSRTTQFGDNIQIIKYNSAGVRKWVFNTGGALSGYNAFDEARSIAVDSNCNVYYTGTVYLNYVNKQELVTGKVDSNGTAVWQTMHGGPDGDDAGNDILLDASGNVYVSGQSSGIPGDLNFILIKYNNAGVEQWARGYEFSAGGIDQANALALDKNGNVFVTGTCQASGGLTDIVTVKYNNSGQLQWARNYNGSANSTDKGTCILTDEQGNAYVGGSTTNNVTGSDVVILKYKNDIAGTLDFAKTKSRKDGPSEEIITAMLIDTSYFRIYFAGNAPKLNSDQITAVRGWYDTGAVDILYEWTENDPIPGSIESKVYGLTTDNRDFSATKYMYMTGVSMDSDSNKNIFLRKYRANGGMANSDVTFFNGNSNGYDGQEGSLNNMVAADNNGKIYIAGASYDSTKGDEMIVLKHYQEDYELTLEVFIQGLYYLNSYNEPRMIPDTVKVFLRNFTAPYAIVDTAKGLINDDANGTFYFSNVTHGTNYYVVVTHRNSLETWRKDPTDFNDNWGSCVFYGFNAAYGDNQIQLAQSITGHRWGNYSGDVNQDGTIDLTDVIQVFNDANLFASGYVATDVTGDDFVDLSDLNMVFNNSNLFASVVRP